MEQAAGRRAPGERIAKAMARAGLCSRREAEAWIAAGRVAVDGQVLTSPAVNVAPGARITVDGKPIPEVQATRLWRYHKPRGLLTTTRDPQGRPTIFDRLPADLPRVVAVGRLDLGSEGLLLLTNDGTLARRLELPATGWTRRYRVRVHGLVDPARLEALAKGVTIDGIRYGPVRAALDRQQGSNAWLTIALSEGKNREVRRICEHLGWPVTRLIRIAYGPFQLGHLPPGAVEEVSGKVLREQLGLARAKPAGPQGERDAHRRRRHKGRALAAPPGTSVRPTADRTREAIFDMLAHNPALRPPGRTSALQDAAVLDAFAGTGAMGLEALSRGAASLVLIERDAGAAAAIEENLRRLGVGAQARLYRADATDPPPRPAGARACDLVFLDPPYGEGLGEPALAALAQRGWVAPGALIVVEIGPRDTLAPPAGFALLAERRYGRARVLLLRAAA